MKVTKELFYFERNILNIQDSRIHQKPQESKESLHSRKAFKEKKRDLEEKVLLRESMYICDIENLDFCRNFCKISKYLLKSICDLRERFQNTTIKINICFLAWVIKKMCQLCFQLQELLEILTISNIILHYYI